MDKLTIIGSFYNEEYLLPYWLKHHVRLFDHGILIDWDSTDNSVDIIKKYAPHWEIRKSSQKHFHRTQVHEEMHRHEITIKGGWQIQTNITEFIFHPDLRGYLNALPPNINGVWLPPISLIDEDCYNPLNPDTPLILQKHYGIIGKNEVRPTNKLIHRKPHGEWKGEGHHDSYMRNTYVAGDAFIVHLGWCPWRNEFIKRKLQIQDKLSEEYKKTVGPGEMGYHITTSEELNRKYLYNRKNYCTNLLFNPIYFYLYQEIEKSYSDPNYKFCPLLVENEPEYNLQRISSLFEATDCSHLIVLKPRKNPRAILQVNTKKEDDPRRFVSSTFDSLCVWVKNGLKTWNVKMVVINKTDGSELVNSDDK